MILTRQSGNTYLQLRDGGDSRTLVGPVMPWGVEALVLDRGREVIETFERGALAADDPASVPLTATHPRDAGTLPIGRTVELEDRADAAWGAWLVSDTALGNEVLALARDQVPLSLSIGFLELPGGSRWSPDRRRVTRTRAALDHVAVVRLAPTAVRPWSGYGRRVASGRRSRSLPSPTSDGGSHGQQVRAEPAHLETAEGAGPTLHRLPPHHRLRRTLRDLQARAAPTPTPPPPPMTKLRLLRPCIGCGRTVRARTRCADCQRLVDQRKTARRPDLHNDQAERRRRAAAVADHRLIVGDWCPGWTGRPAHPSADLTADHVKEVAAGGRATGRLVVRCRSCNAARSAHLARRAMQELGGSPQDGQPTTPRPLKFPTHTAPLDDGPVVA